MMENEHALKIGRLEDKFTLYEPLLKSLHGIASIPVELDKIQGDLETLKDSRAAMREQVTTLFNTQDRAYQDMLRSMENQTRLLEKEIEDCQIDTVDSRLVVVEQDMVTVKTYGGRLTKAEAVIDSFKLKGWDLVFRITPWVLAFASAMYAVISK